MLSEISIRNVVLISTLDLVVKSGLTVLSGETGAGKSIILDSLGMATGARADKGLVRHGSEQAMCSARFELPNTHHVWTVLSEAGFEMDRADDLVLRRTVNNDGRSRGYVNDTPIGQKLLAQIGGLLLEVHGQHDGRGLLDRTTHLSLLDLFADAKPYLAACATSFAALKQAKDDLSSLELSQKTADEDRDFYRHGADELDRLAVKPGEDQAMAMERRLLQNAQGAMSELSAAQSALGADGEYDAKIAQALAGLERVKQKITTGLEPSENEAEEDGELPPSPQFTALTRASGALEKALIELDEARSSVDQAVQAFDFEPSRLNDIEERLFSLRACARKFDVQVDGLVTLRQQFGDALLALDNFDVDLEAAQKKCVTTQAKYDKAALALRKIRQKAAKQLDQAVMAELPPLKMQNARFSTNFSDSEPSANGMDKIVFEVATNPGSALGPLDKIASGGELSRFALAIKVCLAANMGADGQLLLIFDEVDQGVGGAVADAVGRRLLQLGAGGQVMVVTHSPQVAALSNQQLLIEKSVTGKQTKTSVRELETGERAEEIARMLAGETITDAARQAAAQLLQSAGR